LCISLWLYEVCGGLGYARGGGGGECENRERHSWCEEEECIGVKDEEGMYSEEEEEAEDIYKRRG